MELSDTPLTLTELIELTCNLLSSSSIDFALAGGIVADTYRGEPRATDDVDVLVAIDENNLHRGEEVITILGYNPSIATEAVLSGDTRFRRKASQSKPQMIVGRDPAKPYGIDLLLMTFPWAQAALVRAQYNLIELPGIGETPALTVEDLIIAKLFAIKNNPARRYKTSDIPDIALMLENNPDIDLNYLSDALTSLELILPKPIEDESHHILSRVSRKMRKKNRNLGY